MSTEQIEWLDDAALATMLAHAGRTRSQSHDTFSWEHANNYVRLLTELQNRREAEAGTREVGWFIRHDPGCEWQFTNYNPERMPNVRGWESRKAYIATDEALAAPPSSPASGVRVKALEWSSYGGLRWRAKSPLGRFTVNPDSDRRFYVSVNGNPLAGRHATSEDAMVAAQAHFDAAILSALGEHPDGQGRR